MGHDGEERLGRLAAPPLALELGGLVVLVIALGRDVTIGPDETDRSAGGVGHHPGPRQHVVDRAVRKHDPVGEREHVAGGQPGGDAGLHSREVVRVHPQTLGGDDVVDVPGSEPHDLGAAPVDVPVATHEVPRPGAKLRDIEGEGQARLPLLQLGLDGMPVRDLVEHARGPLAADRGDGAVEPARAVGGRLVGALRLARADGAVPLVEPRRLER